MKKTLYTIFSSPYLWLTLLFVLQFFFISAVGEFPLNDDWVHTDTIKHFAQTGEFRLMPFAGPFFYVPILYGTLLVKLFGFSFTLLRLSTLVFMLGSILLTYALTKTITKNTTYALISALTLWLQPIIFHLSFTFMTDIPFLFFSLLSLLLYIKGFSRQSLAYIFFGSIIAVIATYTRQLGILLLVASFFYALTQRKHYSITQLLVAFGIPSVLFAGVYLFIYINNILPGAQGDRLIQGVSRQLGHMRWWSIYIPLYLGWFLLPLTAGYGVAHAKRLLTSKRFWAIQICLLLLVFGIRQTYGLQFPYVQNIFTISGLGPANHVLQGSLLAQFQSYIYAVFTLGASLSTGVFIYTLIEKCTSFDRNTSSPTWIIYVFGLLYVIPIWLLESFDRYLIPLFVVSIFALYTKEKISVLTSTLVLCAFAIISLNGTAQYLDWNAQKWTLATNLSTKTDSYIDAGYEWIGWHYYWDGLSYQGPINHSAPWYVQRLAPQLIDQPAVIFTWDKPTSTHQQLDIKGFGQRRLYVQQNEK